MQTSFACSDSGFFDPASVSCRKCTGATVLSEQKDSPASIRPAATGWDELVCELIDDFTSRYSESLADKTNYCQPARHQQGRHHRRPDACRRGGQPAARPNCTQAECQSTECAVAHSCTAPQEYEAGWVAFTDADDTATGQVKVLCRRCRVPGCDFLEKEWEVTP